MAAPVGLRPASNSKSDYNNDMSVRLINRIRNIFKVCDIPDAGRAACASVTRRGSHARPPGYEGGSRGRAQPPVQTRLTVYGRMPLALAQR